MGFRIQIYVSRAIGWKMGLVTYPSIDAMAGRLKSLQAVGIKYRTMHESELFR
jgi:hypothetical protein